MGKSHDNATFLDDGSSGDLIVNSGHQLQVKSSDGLAFGVIQKGEPNAATGSGIIYNDVNADGHHFKLANTTMLNIDASGRVTKPYQPAFMAYRTTGYTSSTSVNTLVYNSALVNIGGHYSTSTGRFTAPVDGLYEFSYASIGSNDQTTYRYILGYNGSITSGRYELRLDGTNGTSNYLTNGEYGLYIELNANDYVEIYLSSDVADSDIYGSGTYIYTYFRGRLVG